MSRPRSGFVVPFVIAAALAPFPVLAAGSAEAGSPEIRLRQLAEGVWVAHAPGAAPAGLNALVVEREDGLLVVDTLGTPERAAGLLRRLEADGRKPVRYLVFSHAHADATGGASAFPASALVIASRGCRNAFADAEKGLGAEARARAGSATEWVEPPRRAPVLELGFPARLADPRNPVELIPLARGHSAGDLLVRVESSGVFAVGDLVAGDRNPWADEADLTGWIAALNHLSRLQPAVAVPLRGGVTDARGIRVQREAFAWVKGQVEKAFVDLVPAAAIPDRVLAAERLGEYFDVEAKPSFLSGVAKAGLEDVQRERRKRGLPD